MNVSVYKRYSAALGLFRRGQRAIVSDRTGGRLLEFVQSSSNLR